MAKELLSSTGGPSCQYNILLTKIKLAKNELNEAEKYCVEALQYDYMVKIKRVIYKQGLFSIQI